MPHGPPDTTGYGSMEGWAEQRLGGLVSVICRLAELLTCNSTAGQWLCSHGVRRPALLGSRAYFASPRLEGARVTAGVQPRDLLPHLAADKEVEPARAACRTPTRCLLCLSKKGFHYVN